MANVGPEVQRQILDAQENSLRAFKVGDFFRNTLDGMLNAVRASANNDGASINKLINGLERDADALVARFIEQLQTPEFKELLRKANVESRVPHQPQQALDLISRRMDIVPEEAKGTKVPHPTVKLPEGAAVTPTTTGGRRPNQDSLLSAADLANARGAEEFKDIREKLEQRLENKLRLSMPMPSPRPNRPEPRR